MSERPGPAPEPSLHTPARRSRRPRWALLLAALLAAWGLDLPARATDLVGGNDDHAFLATAPGGGPVAWDNCRALHYVVNPQGAPTGWEGVLDAATDEIERASGYVFVRDGTTTDRAFRAGRAMGDPILVGWAVRREVGTIGDGAAGLGGPVTFDTDEGPRHGSGMVVFDALYTAALDRSGRTADLVMIAEHELMHVLGLGHVDDRSQVMAESGHYGGDASLGDGDVAGLRALRAVPCPGGTVAGSAAALPTTGPADRSPGRM